MDFDELCQLVEKHCKALLQHKGEIYFGSQSALSNPNGIALVDLNPGGTGLDTLSQDLVHWEKSQQRVDSVAYLDMCWHEPFFSERRTCERCCSSLEDPELGHVHLQPHQKRVLEISRSVGFDLRSSLAFNAIWLQTKDAEALVDLLNKLHLDSMQSVFCTYFFRFFREFFDKCNTRLVICLGNGEEESSFALFRDALAVPSKEVRWVGNNFKDGKYFVHEGSNKVVYFGVPHPSRHAFSDVGLQKLKQLWLEVKSSSLQH